MRRRWIRVEPGRSEKLEALMTAGTVAAVVGAVTYYLTRMLLARDPIHPPPAERADDGAGVEAGRGA